MQQDKLLLMIWFAGISGFFLVFSAVFITMAQSERYSHIIIYEPNRLVFWSEFLLMLFVLYVTLWILYNYITGKGTLEIVKNNKAKKI